MARTVLADSRAVAQDVLNGTGSLETAYEAARDLQRSASSPAEDTGADVAVSPPAAATETVPDEQEEQATPVVDTPADAVKAKADRAAIKAPKPVPDVTRAADRADANAKAKPVAAEDAVTPSDDQRKAALRLAVVNDNVVTFVPKEDGEPVIEGDPLVDGNAAATDIADHGVGAHAIYGAMSIIDLAQTTPEAFWAIFGTAGRTPDALKYLDTAIRKLAAIKAGQPEAAE